MINYFFNNECEVNEMDDLDNRLNNIIASDIMTPVSTTIRPDESLSRALSLMDKYGSYEIPVVDQGHVVGLVSYAVLVKRRNLPLSVPVERVMYPAPSISASSPIPSISEILLTNDFSSAPVLDNGRLLGIVKRRAIIKKLFEESIFVNLPVTDIMTTPIMTVNETDDIAKALHEMKHLEERALPVIDLSGKLVGVIALDKLDKFIRGKRERASKGEIIGERISPKIEVKSAMTVSPASVSLDSRLGEVMEIIANQKISSVIVIDDNAPVGIITGLDIIELAASAKPRKEVLVQISGFEADDPYIFDSLYTQIQRYLPKISNHVIPRMINFHITHHHHLDSMTKYTISGRMTTPRRTFITKKNDWDVIKAMDEVMASFTKQVKKYKEKAKEHH